MSSSIKIEKNVPLPARVPPLPLDKLKIGDSFLVPLKNKSDKAAIRQRLHRFQLNNVPVCLSMQKEGDNAVRVYRIKDRVIKKKTRKRRSKK
jgi:hypothetical protein